MPPNDRIRPTDGGADLDMQAAGGRVCIQYRGCVKCARLSSRCDFHREPLPPALVDLLMRQCPGDISRGGGWQFQHPDGSWRVVEAKVAGA